MVNDAVMSYLVEGARTVAINGVFTVKGKVDRPGTAAGGIDFYYAKVLNITVKCRV